MINFFKRVILWIYIKIYSILINISIALYNTEVNILKANPDDLSEKKKKLTNRLHRVSFLNKFHAGQKDEKYVKDYYELLKKADDFKKKSTPFKQAVAADKHVKTYGQKDKYGRRYEHFGFFDEKHKHAGKTIGEVLDIEMKERRSSDDDYELINIFNNKPIDCGVSKFIDIEDNNKKQYKSKKVVYNQNIIIGDKTYGNINDVSRVLEFPIKIYRDNEVINKIEELTEFLHVKKTAFEHRLLEFYVPLKYKTSNYEDDDKIIKELISIKEVYINNDYGKLLGYGVSEFIKRFNHNDEYEVFKFKGIEYDIVG